MDYGKEFKKYAKDHLLLNSLTTDNVIDHQIKSMTPMIIEERQMNLISMSVFDRLMKDRIVWVSTGIDSRIASVIQAQLMFLDSVEKKDIIMHLDTPGGSVLAGLGIRDVMNYVSSDIATINTGMCASMGSVLVSSGTKGKRSSLIFSKVMTHQVSNGQNGNIQDNRISQMEAEKYNYILFKILAENCGKTFNEVIDISRRDKWFSSEEALEFGLIDDIIGIDKHKSVSNYMEGFDDYYKKEVLGIN